VKSIQIVTFGVLCAESGMQLAGLMAQRLTASDTDFRWAVIALFFMILASILSGIVVAGEAKTTTLH
jgi:hypothetical protein